MDKLTEIQAHHAEGGFGALSSDEVEWLIAEVARLRELLHERDDELVLARQTLELLRADPLERP